VHKPISRSTGSAIVLEAIAATVALPFLAIFGVVLARAGWFPYRSYITGSRLR
jgi:hypothetical protein